MFNNVTCITNIYLLTLAVLMKNIKLNNNISDIDLPAINLFET